MHRESMRRTNCVVNAEIPIVIFLFPVAVMPKAARVHSPAPASSAMAALRALQLL
jgi:hypothetical protein